SRTLIARKLLGLEEVIGMTVVDPVRDERGWAFRDPVLSSEPSANLSVSFASTDPINGFHFLAEAYELTDPNFDGRFTVPVLWDRETRRIVTNCEDDICRMFNDAFCGSAKHQKFDLFPKEIVAEQAKLTEFLSGYTDNGPYRQG